MAWVAAIVQGVMGGIQMGVSMDQLSKLPSAKSYSPATDLETATSMSRRAAQQGMTPQERAVAEQAIGTAQSRTQRAMEQRGLGNLAAAVSQIRTTEAYNQLEAQNQQIKRQSLGQYANLAGQMQSLQNQNISSFNQMLYAQQQALGQSARAGFSNLTMGLGELIAEGVEGKDAVDKAALGKSTMVSMPQMGYGDTTAYKEADLSTMNMDPNAGYGDISTSNIQPSPNQRMDMAPAIGSASSPFMPQETLPTQPFESQIPLSEMNTGLSASPTTFLANPLNAFTSPETFGASMIGGMSDLQLANSSLGDLSTPTTGF
jgi:hypothetical protein